MLKIVKYFKPFTGLLLVAVLLLFIQAMANLLLPYYMSNIVNVGIQQEGIENSIPKAIRQSEMKVLTKYMSLEEENIVLENYNLINKSSAGYGKYLAAYPELNNQPVYVLKDIDKDNMRKLNHILGKTFLVSEKIESIDVEGISEEQLRLVIDEINEDVSVLGDTTINQMVARTIKLEYEALGADVGKMQNQYIILLGVKMIVLSVLSALCVVGVGFFASKIAAGLARNLRKKLFEKVESFSKREFDKLSTASLITRTTNDITQIQTLVVMMIRTFFYAPFVAVGGIILALQKSPSMSWIIAVAVIALLTLIITIYKNAVPKFKIIQALVDKLNLVTRENLSGLMVIRAFNTQKFEEKRFDNTNKRLTDNNLFVNRIMVIMHPTMLLIMNGITLLIVWVGAQKISSLSMQVGDMMAFMQYAMQIIFSFLMMSFMFIMIPRASVAAQRISEVLEIVPVIVDPEKQKEFDEGQMGVVEFKNVYFKYYGAEEYVLKNISFKTKPNNITAIIGSTGSGKTTLTNLIPRFYDVTSGSVLVDGVDVRDVSQYELRNKIGYVPQKSMLFSGTVESNLKYANDNATNYELFEALEISQASEFVMENNENIFSSISQGGSNLSGGQKQRLSIARALVKKPEIYIFDDSFSALDFKTDSDLRKALKEKTKSSTIIIVAQRVSTIMKAEQIIVLEEGEIVGIGNHEELMRNCRTYKEIALSQLSMEELA
jgi:ATP-binding cassette subfamily B protein